MTSTASYLVDLAVAGDLTAGLPAPRDVTAEVGEPAPTPGQAPTGGFEQWEVSPGLLGFVPVFLIALACVGLFLSLTRQMRRVAVRQAQRDAEDAAAAAEAPDADGRPAETRAAETRAAEDRHAEDADGPPGDRTGPGDGTPGAR